MVKKLLENETLSIYHKYTSSISCLWINNRITRYINIFDNGSSVIHYFKYIILLAKNNSTLRNFNRSRYSLRRLGSTTIKPNITLNDTSTELIVDETTLSPNKTKVTTTTAVPRTTKKPSNVTTTTIKTPATETVITTTTEKPSLKCGIAPIDETYPWIAVIEHIDPTKQNSRVSLSKGVLIDDRHVITTVSSIHNALPFWTM